VPVTASAHSKPVTGLGAMVSAWNGAHKAVIRALGFHCSLIYECLGRFRPDRR
jgi:hypothetical protein